MLLEDTTAFVEQLEAPVGTRRRSRQHRRLAQAEVELLRARWDADVTSSAVRELELELTEGRSSAPARVLDRRLSAFRTHLRNARDELDVRQRQLDRLERAAHGHSVTSGVTTFRLHSRHHHLDCSERRFARLSCAQLRRPVLVTKQDGRRWWWYRNRFWWDDAGLRAGEVEQMVLSFDLQSTSRLDASSVRESLEAEVWSRDHGRCVDCGSTDGVLSDTIIEGGATAHETARNLELRCRECRARRDHNESRTKVLHARFDVLPYERFAFWRRGLPDSHVT
jgi:hypothetical protein